MRIVISDFLFPHDPGRLIRRLAAGSSALWVIQVLNAWESQPTELGGRRLIDRETGAAMDLKLDRRTIAAYRERLLRLQSELSGECRRTRSAFVTVIAERGLMQACRDELCSAGILQVA